jgi:serine/threonine protein kinase
MDRLIFVGAILTSISTALIFPIRSTIIRPVCSCRKSSSNGGDEWSDFDGFVGGDTTSEDAPDDGWSAFSAFQDKMKLTDLSACQSRQFSLGPDLVLSSFVGTMGFDEVTDWQYYYQDEDDPNERKVIQPNPFDSNQPRRTRQSSGSVVRLFRGEFVGQPGGILSAQGKDRRVLVKEYTGDLALRLARAELQAIGKLQSEMLLANGDEQTKKGDWLQVAASRSVKAREDNSNLCSLVGWLSKAPFLGILGEVNLAELEDMTPNDFYQALGVPPPKPNAVWLVFEYAGLTSFQAYSEPAEIRRGRLPVKKGFFGNPIEPPPLPSFKDRANYVVKGIMKQAILAVAHVHENGLVHRSLGRSSFFISSTAMDKREASSPYETRATQLIVKLADFGFAGPQSESTLDEEFLARARSIGLNFRKGEKSIAATNFAIAEDMHALGFVFSGLLLSSLADASLTDSPVPSTDEDTMQRLIGDIFDKDIKQFRDYVKAEECWVNLVSLLDENEGAGWTVLEKLILARETAARNKDGEQIFTVRGLLTNPFFQ